MIVPVKRTSVPAGKGQVRSQSFAQAVAPQTYLLSVAKSMMMSDFPLRSHGALWTVPGMTNVARLEQRAHLSQGIPQAIASRHEMTHPEVVTRRPA